mmetsp:Transcript_20739/g.49419  ORF Transcript_20739/g.49419 Transcript_20739/m.49419 type:complete len:112 (+) Transcript_20739:1-336(+)
MIGGAAGAAAAVAMLVVVGYHMVVKRRRGGADAALTEVVSAGVPISISLQQQRGQGMDKRAVESLLFAVEENCIAPTWHAGAAALEPMDSQDLSLASLVAPVSHQTEQLPE